MCVHVSAVSFLDSLVVWCVCSRIYFSSWHILRCGKEYDFFIKYSDFVFFRLHVVCSVRIATIVLEQRELALAYTLCIILCDVICD